MDGEPTTGIGLHGFGEVHREKAKLISPTWHLALDAFVGCARPFSGWVLGSAELRALGDQKGRQSVDVNYESLLTEMHDALTLGVSPFMQ